MVNTGTNLLENTTFVACYRLHLHRAYLSLDELTCRRWWGFFAPPPRFEPTLFSRHLPWPSLPAHSRTPSRRRPPWNQRTPPCHPLLGDARERTQPGRVKAGSGLIGVRLWRKMRNEALHRAQHAVWFLSLNVIRKHRTDLSHSLTLSAYLLFQHDVTSKLFVPLEYTVNVARFKSHYIYYILRYFILLVIHY